LEVFPPHSIVPEILVSDTGILYLSIRDLEIVFSIAPESTKMKIRVGSSKSSKNEKTG